MSTEIGNAITRVYQSMGSEFEICVERVCEKFATYCDSPIEVMLGSAIGLVANLGKPGFAVLVKSGDELPSKSNLAIVPQFQWRNYRFDFALMIWGVTLFVECDGHDYHERTKEQAAHDRQKDRAAQEAGYAILRFTGSEIYRDPSACAGQIFKFLTAAMDRAAEK